MIDKSLVKLAYATVGAAIGVLPLLPRVFPRVGQLFEDPDWLDYVDYALVALLLAAVANGSVQPYLLAGLAAVAVLCGALQQRREPLAYAGLATGLGLTCTLIWWQRFPGNALGLSPAQMGGFALLAASTALGLRETGRRPAASSALAHWPFLAYLAASAVLAVSTVMFRLAAPTIMAWHHWGAYVGPAELLLSGAHLLSDFPAQYGIGPTLLLAATCGRDCWGAMYYLVAAMNFAGMAVLGALVLMVSAGAGRRLQATVLLLMLACAGLWAGLPSQLTSPLAFPSVGGLRFLPVLVLTWIAIRSARQGAALPLVGHAVWGLGLLWSVESAFYCTFVWWPAALACSLRQGAGDAVPAGYRLARAAAGLVGVLAITVLAGMAVYYGVYGELPSRLGLFAYAIYPPGPLPIAPGGAVLFVLALLVLATATLVRLVKLDSSAALQHFCLLLPSYAALSYFLVGRSHDNNVLNIAPLLLLLTLSVALHSPRLPWRQAAVGVMAGLAGWLVAFHWEGWEAALGADSAGMPGGASIVERFDFRQAGMRRALQVDYEGMTSDPADIAQMFDMLRLTGLGPATLFHSAMLLPRTAPGQAWNALHGPENYAFLPAAVRRQFMLRTARRLQRCGWVVIDGRYADGYQAYPSKVEWLQDYDAVYDMDQQLRIGDLQAFHMRPKGMAQCPAIRPR